MVRDYRNPDGAISHCEDDYCAAWENLIGPVLAATGYMLQGFDPDYQIRNGDGHNVRLSVDFVEKINAALGATQ